MTNGNYSPFFADDGYDDYDYKACGSSRRFRQITDASFYGDFGDFIPGTDEFDLVIKR